MGPDPAHRGVPVPLSTLSHPGTLSFHCEMSLKLKRQLFYHLCLSQLQRLKVDLDRSTSVNQLLGARVARCSLVGLADFLYR